MSRPTHWRARRTRSLHLNPARRIDRIPDPDRNPRLAQKFVREARRVGKIYGNASKIAGAGRFRAFDKKLDAIRAHVRLARRAAHEFRFKRGGH